MLLEWHLRSYKQPALAVWRRTLLVVAWICAGYISGCGSSNDKSTPAPSATPANHNQAATPRITATTAAPERTVKESLADPIATAPRTPPAASTFPDDESVDNLFRPEVILSAQHAASSPLHVDATFPNLEIQALTGETTTLAEHLGQTLTVVLFWDYHQPMSRDALEYITNQLAPKFAASGVSFVAVHLRDETQAVAAAVERLRGKPSTWYDATGQAFPQVATAHLPRVYLLKSDRTITWFDIEFSRSTRRELKNALLYTLNEMGVGRQ